MRDTASACVARGVAIGAHVSYRDRDGFGRRVVALPVAELVQDLVDQWTALTAQVDAVGGTVAFVKPHGALYHQMGTDPTVAEAVVRAVMDAGVPLVAQTGTLVADRANQAGVRVVGEGFPDRAYLLDGRLAPRDTTRGAHRGPRRGGPSRRVHDPAGWDRGRRRHVDGGGGPNALHPWGRRRCRRHRPGGSGCAGGERDQGPVLCRREQHGGTVGTPGT